MSPGVALTLLAPATVDAILRGLARRAARASVVHDDLGLGVGFRLGKLPHSLPPEGAQLDDVTFDQEVLHCAELGVLKRVPIKRSKGRPAS